MERQKYNLNKLLKAKKERDDKKAPTKTELRLEKNQKSKHSYHNASEEKKKGRNKIKQIRPRDARAELAKNLSVKRAFLDRRNKGTATANELNKFETMHNAVYLSKVDRFAETQREREGTLLFGKLCKNVSFVPARVQTLASGTHFLRTLLAVKLARVTIKR